MSKTTIDYDVAIIGYGPTGVTAANFLGSYGITTLVIERVRDVYSRARAVTVDGTTMRTFQALGLDDAAKADMDVTTALRWKTYSGHEFLRVTPGGPPVGHATSYMIFQPALEATLRGGAERYSKTVDIQFEREFVTLQQDDDAVAVTTRALADGTEQIHRVKYVIGADGGSSLVRKAIGSVMDGSTRARTWIVIDAKIKRWWPEREILTFWSDADRPVVDIPLALDHHRWEIPLGPDEKKEDFESDEVIWGLLAPLGVTPEKVDIVSHAFYNHHVRKADTWRVGRVMLAGDSAHLMPPWAGQGMQSGIRDAANLAWKLRAILQGGVSDALLDSYQPERAPLVQAVTESSISLGKLIEAEKGPGQFIRNRVIPVIAALPVLGDGFRNSLVVKIDLKTGFLSAPPAKGSPVGQYLPQPTVARQDGHRVLLDSVFGTDFVVLGLDVDPAAVLTEEQKAGWAAFSPRYITARSSQAAPQSDLEVVDFTNLLAPWFAQFGAKVVVVRPDRYVAASDNTTLDVPLLASNR